MILKIIQASVIHITDKPSICSSMISELSQLAYLAIVIKKTHDEKLAELMADNLSNVSDIFSDSGYDSDYDHEDSVIKNQNCAPIIRL